MKSFLKLASAIFLSNFYFSPYDSPSKTMIFLKFLLKGSSCSQDIQFFVFSSSPVCLPVSHCFRSWSKKNIKVYDVINCLNKNLRTHFVSYLEKEIRCDIETLSIDRVLNKEYSYRKLWRKCAPKASLRHLFNFAK